MKNSRPQEETNNTYKIVNYSHTSAFEQIVSLEVLAVKFQMYNLQCPLHMAA